MSTPEKITKIARFAQKNKELQKEIDTLRAKLEQLTEQYNHALARVKNTEKAYHLEHASHNNTAEKLTWAEEERDKALVRAKTAKNEHRVERMIVGVTELRKEIDLLTSLLKEK